VRANPLLQTRVTIGGRAPRPVSGDGVFMILDDGREILDAATTPAGLGHRHPKLIAAVREALETAPILDEGWAWPERDAAARTLLDLAFGDDQEWIGAVRFAVTGSEANDIALSLAQALTGRVPLVTRERAYHGLVGLAREMTVQPHWHGGLSALGGGVRPAPRLADVRRLPFPAGMFGSGLELPRTEAERVLAGAEDQLSDAAAVIVDYSQGGHYSAPAYQDVLADLARKVGALWIADEVVTSLGRSGRWMNFTYGEARPDIVTLGKALGGGVAPVAAVVVSKDVLSEMGESLWQNYSTLRAHPCAVAAARAFVETVHEEELVSCVPALHSLIAAGMRDLAAAHPSIERIDGRGLHWTIEMHGPDWREWRADTAEAPIASRVAARVLEEGVLVATSGEQTSVYLSMALIMTEANLERIFNALHAGFEVADEEVETMGLHDAS
jgi:4-aminobutyrate aminotransferase-like enzyme